jgi:hypothetical protein
MSPTVKSRRVRDSAHEMLVLVCIETECEGGGGDTGQTGTA